MSKTLAIPLLVILFAILMVMITYVIIWVAAEIGARRQGVREEHYWHYWTGRNVLKWLGYIIPEGNSWRGRGTSRLRVGLGLAMAVVVGLFTGFLALRVRERPVEAMAEAAMSIDSLSQMAAAEEARKELARALAAIDVGKTEEAQSHLEKAAVASPELVVNFGRTTEEVATSVQVAVGREILREYPSSAYAWLILANAQSSMGEHSQARAALDSAIELDPAFAPAYVALSSSYLSTKDVDRAEKYAKKALDLAPNAPSAWSAFATVLVAQNRLEEAKLAYLRSAELASSDSVLRSEGVDDQEEHN